MVLWGFYALLAYMPFHIFLSQSLSLATGGLAAWKGAKDVFTLGLVVLAVVLVWYRRRSSRLFNILVGLAVVYGGLHLVIWAAHPSIYSESALIGTVYNNRLLWYLLIGTGAGLLWSKRLVHSSVMRTVLVLSTLVCLLGIVQYFLLSFGSWDVLSHLGYSLERGARSAFFIDDKPDLPRIMSTLRDPNSLGAFLILPITMLVYKLVYSPPIRRTLLIGLLGLHGLALFLTFSRSAWAGTLISVAVVMLFYARAKTKQLILLYWPLVLGLIVAVGIVGFMLRDQYTVQNIISHSDENTTAQFDSNEFHLEYARRGADSIADEPFGNGPGTAGLASIQNPSGGFLTENFYLQIGYEVGVFGLMVFVAVLALVYGSLLKAGGPLAYALIGGFWGYAFVNLLLHTWSNEAVAAQWWLLAGLVLASNQTKKV